MKRVQEFYLPVNVDEGVCISDDCTHRSDVCSLFSIHVQVCELSSDDAFSFILYYGLKWDVDSTHSSCVLSIEKNLPDDIRKEVLLGTENGAYGSFMNAVADHYTEKYHQKKERRWKSKINKVISRSGSPRGCMRGVRCPVCRVYQFHNCVICPTCATLGRKTWIVLSCPDETCIASKKKRHEAEQMSVEELSKYTCNGKDRICVDEIYTVFPLDFLCSLYKFGALDIIKNSTRTEEYLLTKYAIDNKKTYYGTSLSIAVVNKVLNEAALSSLQLQASDNVKGPDELRNVLDDGISQFCQPDSIERQLFGIGMR